jgi:hypothetical protein
MSEDITYWRNRAEEAERKLEALGNGTPAAENPSEPKGPTGREKGLAEVRKRFGNKGDGNGSTPTGKAAGLAEAQKRFGSPEARAANEEQLAAHANLIASARD